MTTHLTTEEVAEQLGLSVQAVLKRAGRRHLQPARKYGPTYVWGAQHVAAIAAELPAQRSVKEKND